MAVVRGELSPDEIRRVGLAIVMADGLEAVSMRRVADALGVWPTAVYHHVGDKDGLVQLVLDAVLAELPVPDFALAWDAWLRAFATAARDVLRRYPGVAGHLSEFGNASRPALELFDGALGVLIRDGFPPRDAVVLFSDFFMFLLCRIRRDDAVAAEARRRSVTSAVDAALGVGWGLPHLAVCRAALGELTADDYLVEGVETIVRGAAGTIQAATSAASPAAPPDSTGRTGSSE